MSNRITRVLDALADVLAVDFDGLCSVDLELRSDGRAHLVFTSNRTGLEVSRRRLRRDDDGSWVELKQYAYPRDRSE